jgi:hypothetical protein
VPHLPATARLSRALAEPGVPGAGDGFGTATPGCLVVMARVASTPFITGVCRSLTTTSGWSAATALTACCPSAASSTPSIPGIVEIAVTRPSG